MSVLSEDLFDRWFEALEQRYLCELTFPEVRRALQALSSLYVHRRERVRCGAALSGAGKRAAFALFYGPLHFRVAWHVAAGLDIPAVTRIHDLGCGTGAAGAAWALGQNRRTKLQGLDLNPWAVGEAEWNQKWFGLSGANRTGRIEQEKLPGAGSGILLAFTVNEIGDAFRPALLSGLLDAAGRGARVLVLEPIARRLVPWWDSWADGFRQAGGRADEWRFTAEFPERWRLLDKASGLDHSTLTARSLLL